MTDGKGYTRVVVTDAGGSAFDDAELDLTSQSVATGTPPMLVGGLPCSGGVMYLQRGAAYSQARLIPLAKTMRARIVLANAPNDSTRPGRPLGEGLQPPRGFDAVESRHTDVHQHNICAGRRHCGDRVLAVATLGDDLQTVGGRKDASQARANNRLIVDDGHPDHRAERASARPVVLVCKDDAREARATRGRRR
jgi:hypothetical protein